MFKIAIYLLFLVFSCDLYLLESSADEQSITEKEAIYDDDNEAAPLATEDSLSKGLLANKLYSSALNVIQQPTLAKKLLNDPVLSKTLFSKLEEASNLGNSDATFTLAQALLVILVTLRNRLLFSNLT
jgi:hypothetical protein